MSSLGLSLLNDDVGHFITLPLCSNVSSKTLLAEFEGTFVFRDPQQFHSTLFIGGEADNLSDQVTYKFVMLWEENED